MKRLVYFLLLQAMTLAATAQSLFEQYERYLTTPRTYVCYFYFIFFSSVLRTAPTPAVISLKY